jgi:hypothetical protein
VGRPLAALFGAYGIGVVRERRRKDTTLSDIVRQQKQHTESLTALQHGHEAQGAQLRDLDEKVANMHCDVGHLQTTKRPNRRGTTLGAFLSQRRVQAALLWQIHPSHGS